jgi:NADH-quinone oxidoreductase subunit I
MTNATLDKPKELGALHGKGAVRVVIEKTRGTVPATLKGLGVTLKNMIDNLTGKVAPTISYPEEKRNYSERFRGVHVLTQRPDGSPKCVACFMCSTVCPADCIYIVAGEKPDKGIEKYPVTFEIDMLRCVMCGLCIDACPEEAIVMSKEYEMAAFTREDTIYDLTRLMYRKSAEEWGLGYRPRYDKLTTPSQPVEHPRDVKTPRDAKRETIAV